jgi:prepilin-type N-terminal cleavage/methylation domain-containing protein
VRTERAVGTGGEAGFTLVEVMFAMVIIMVGLLGLESLGTMASRSITRADRQSIHATMASDSLESALHQLRQGTVPSQFCTIVRFGDSLSRRVDLTNPQLAQVTVSIVPNPNAPNVNALQITSSLYLPVALSGTAAGQACG